MNTVIKMFWSDKKILKLDIDDRYNLVSLLKTIELYIFEMVSFMVCELYLILKKDKEKIGVS